MARSESTTKPQLPSDETPLTGEDVAHMLGAMPPRMILVGGQALAFWMEHYGIKAGAGAEITSDGDVLGTLEEARLLARRLDNITTVDGHPLSSKKRAFWPAGWTESCGYHQYVQ